MSTPGAATPQDLAAFLHVLQLGGARAALSHEVAAELLGIELLEPVVTKRLTVPRNRSRLTVPGWAVVRADIPADELVRQDGLRITAPVRTVADLTRALPAGEALVAADSALRLGLADHDGLLRRLGTAQGRGAARLRQVARHLDASSGSVLESLLRWTFVEAGLPAPRTQYRILDQDGELVARVDFCWPEHRLVVEADGYAFHSDRAAYRRDRERTNALVRLGWNVLRFTWEDVRGRPEHVVAVVRECLIRGNGDVAAHEVRCSAA